MYSKSEVFYIKMISPTHVGSGSDLGIVDMPIQRESHTNFPKIEGSSLKGSLREAVENNCNDEVKIHLIFGFDETNASEKVKQKFEDKKGQFAGAIGFSDAKILFFPVKSVKGVFAYVTCKDVLERYKRDLEYSSKKAIFEIPSENSVSSNSEILVNDNVVILEEYSFEVNKDKKVDLLGKFLENELGENITNKIIILSNDDFKDFVTMFTEVITRTKIDNNTGTVKDGALFTEEYLPSETIMYSLIFASNIKGDIEEYKNNLDDKEVIQFFKNNIGEVIQIGGNATIGKGLCKIIAKRNSNGANS